MATGCPFSDERKKKRGERRIEKEGKGERRKERENLVEDNWSVPST